MFRAHRVFSLLQPRRPRHPFVQAVLTVFVVCAFLALLATGAVVAVIALAVATLARAFGFTRPIAFTRPIGFTVNRHAQPQPQAATHATATGEDVIDGEFRVVDKSIPHGPQA